MSDSIVTVIKTGGRVLEDASTRERLLDAVATIPGARVLVHGGGAQASAWATKAGLEPRMIDGRRVTDANMLEIVTMVYGGLVNRTLVAELQGRGCDAVGLAGADRDVIRAVRRPSEPVDFGFVGDISAVRSDLLLRMLDEGVLPVIAPLTHDGRGSLLNTNADTIASAVAASLASQREVRLLLCFDRRGVLDAGGHTIPLIHENEMRLRMADGEISAGMLPKLEAAFAARRAGVRRVALCHADDLASVAAAAEPTELEASMDACWTEAVMEMS